MTRLSVNINKFALIRNSRGKNLPNLLQVAQDCEKFGAQGITVHPRQDERHIHYADVAPLKNVVATEFNIEGFPDGRFMKMVLEICPHQCTLVPDASNQLTSDHGWDTIAERDFLKPIVSKLREKGIRVSLFLNAEQKLVEGAREAGADRIEFYTGKFAEDFSVNREKAIEPHIKAAKIAQEIGLGINAGHDLNLDNLKFYKDSIENLAEVSIGHALICNALYFGLEVTIQKYLSELS